MLSELQRKFPQQSLFEVQLSLLTPHAAQNPFVPHTTDRPCVGWQQSVLTVQA
jgi:hypothetical protein